MNVLPLPENFTIQIEPLNNVLFSKKNIAVSMLRLDTIHPVVSGNKIFKLSYFLLESKKSFNKKIITFGGAYSNHLAATAYACRISGIKRIGFVRGEKPEFLSHTLRFCLENEMQLEFISRSDYRTINEDAFLKSVQERFGDHILIPEGGFSQQGIRGAELIYHYFNQDNFTHICCPIGTATTFAGLIQKSTNTETIGFSVLKNLADINERLQKACVSLTKKYKIIDDYHFGGYAKRNEVLTDFMNQFYEENKIPLDFVYTAKMMFGIYDLINKNYFSPGSKILCIHTGGLQGNESLPAGTLNF